MELPAVKLGPQAALVNEARSKKQLVCKEDDCLSKLIKTIKSK